MKLIILYFFFIFSILIITCNTNNKECEHDWKWKTILEPTCITSGSKIEICSKCNEESGNSESITAFGHSINKNYNCSICFNPYKLGDTGPGGGVIIYRKETGFTMVDNGEICYYLEVSYSLIGSKLTFASGNCSMTSLMTGSQLGYGRRNTANILSIDPNAPAAKACKEYRGPNNKDDWFLPSIDELALSSSFEAEYAFLNITKYIENFEKGIYLSSSEKAGEEIWGKDSNNPMFWLSVSMYYYPSLVRAVRAF